MAATGISVAESAIEEFENFKLRKSKEKFIVYQVVDGSVVVEQKSDNPSFPDFIAMLPVDACRYITYDMNFTTNDGRPNSKVVLISWVPDTAKIKDKMVYSGSKEAVKRAFVGISVNVNATDLSELTEDIVVEACRKFA